MANLSSTKQIETDSTIDSVVWDAVLLGNGSGVAVLWAAIDNSSVYLSMANRGGSIGTKFALSLSGTEFHAAAAGTNRIAVVAAGGTPTLAIYDSNGSVTKTPTALAAGTLYDVEALGDGSFVVKWVSGTSTLYTRYAQDGSAMAGQTARQLTTGDPELNVKPTSFASDASGGFLYNAQLDANAANGSVLRYVDNTGAVTKTINVAAGYRGTLAYDGTDFWYFYGNTTNNQVYMQKVSIAGSGSLVGSAVAISGYSTTITTRVEVLGNGHFLLEDEGQTKALWIDSAGTILDTYLPAADHYPSIGPATDSGGLLFDNYLNGATQYDISVSNFDSGYLVAPPNIATAGTLTFADTPAADTLAASAAALTVTSTETPVTAYGIQGGTTGISHTIGAITYNVSKAGSYGTLYLKSTTGQYAYEPNNPAINGLSANTSDSFTMTGSSTAATSGTATLTVNITGVNDLPLIANLSGTHQFTAGASNPATDNANIAPTTVAVTDVDSANFSSGSVQINQSSGATDGYFFTDVTKVKSGATAAGADGRFSAGENVYVDTSGTGTTFTSIGTVAAAGGVLHIDFNANATPATVTWLLKYLTYGAPTTGSRSFTLQVNDGDGGTSAASSFTMNGVDLTPPTLSSSTPADNASSVSTNVSPQIVFSEPVKFGTGKVYLVDVAANTVVEQFDVVTAQGTADGKVSISGSTLTINPTASLDYSKAYAIKVDSGAITDIAGNAFSGISNTTTFNFTTIANPPTLSIDASPASLAVGQHATITFTFSATPVGFTATDIDVTGGTLTTPTVDPLNDKIYTADFTPSVVQSLNATIQVTAGKFTNSSSESNLASNVLSITGDTLAPTVASIVRSAPAGAQTNADSLTFLVTFSEAVGANLDASDFAVTGSTATVSSVSSAGGNAYSVTVTGGDLASYNGTVGLTISAGNDLADAAGNGLSSRTPTGANQSYTVDNTVSAPTIALNADTGASSSDGITSDNMINVTLATDVASWEYSTNGGTGWNAGTSTSFTLADGSYAVGAMQVRQTDTAGNLSTAASNAAAITIDRAAAPPAFALHSDSGASASDGITKDGTVDVTLPADTASWEYSVNNGANWSAGSGTTFTVAEGSYAIGTVKVRYTDVAGNQSTAASNAGVIKVDQTVALPALALAADTGASSSDGLTSNTTVNVTLETDVASWEYSVDGGAHWTTGSGTSFSLAEGSHAAGAVQVRQTDTAGNLSAAASNAAAMTVDTTANAPSFALAADSGASASDGITSNGTVNVTLPGDTASWQYSVDGGDHWNTGSGASFSLAAGDYANGDVQVRYTDNAGNLSAAASSSAAISIDTSASAPTFGLAADTGASATDGITRNATVNVTLPGDTDTWEYSVDNGAHWAAGSGASFSLASATYAAGDIQVRYTDLAGNASPAASNAASITVDTTVAAPAFALAADTGSSSSDGITSNTAVNVTLAADVASWEYSSDGGAHWAAGSGTSFTLADGSYSVGTVQVRQTDVAGNLSATASNTAAITIDSVAAAPAFALASDTGASSSDGITSNGTVNVTLPADTNSWEYSIDGGAHWTAGSGTSFTLDEGTYASGSLKLRYTDVAGNLSSAASNLATVTIDQTVPVPTLQLAADTGTSSSDGITSNNTINVTLATDVASWQYSVDGGANWNAATGTSFTLADGSYAAGAVRVRQTDTAGNLSGAAPSVATIVIDRAAASAAFALHLDSGASASDGITKDGTIDVTLPADTASWEFSVDGGANWNSGSGSTFSLAEGSYAIGAVKLRYTDVAGNQSAATSNAGAIKVDQTVALPALALAADTGASSSDGLTSNTTVNVTLATDVASWEYSVDGGANWTTGSGTSFTLAEGSHAAGAVQVRQTDTAGNRSTATSNPAAITIDTTANAQSLALAADSGASAADGITNNGTVNVTLPVDTASWQYSVDGGGHWNTGSGTSFSLTAGAYASGDVQARYTDNAGNLSAAASNAASITIDTSAAAPAFALAADTGTSASDGITRNATVNVTLPGDTATWEYSVDGGGHWAAGSGASFSLSSATYAAGDIQVRYTDLAGNSSAATSNPGSITVDATVAAPAFALAADTGASSSDGITSNTAVNVTLAADVASWEYSSDAGAHWTAGSGTGFTLTDGSYSVGTVRVRQTDTAGNLSAAASNAASITIDSAASTPALALAADTGASGSDGITSNGTVIVTLPADTDSWEYSVDAGAQWTPGSGGSFTLGAGSYAGGSVQVRYTDLAGNHGAAASIAAAITVDQVVPVPALQLAADTGTSSSDGLTNNAAVNVTLAADAVSWEYTLNGGAHWNTGIGTSFTLAEGTYAAGTVQVRQTDIAGNTSATASNGGAFMLDTAAPAPTLALAVDSGASAIDGITNNGIVNATLPADTASWEYSVDGGANWNTGSGASFTLAAGSYASGTVKLRYTDNAGNASPSAGSAATIRVDHTVAAPALALAADTGISSSDGLTRNTSVNVTLAVDVASWEYSFDAGATWTAGSGTAFTLADGSYAAGTVLARQTDIAGNLSATAANVAAITIDTVATAPVLSIAADTGASASDGITMNGTVNLTLPVDTASWEYSVDGGGNWSAGSGTSFTLAEGSYAGGAVQVRYTDNAANLSAAASNPSMLRIDHTVAAPALALAADTGISSSDGVTRNTSVNVTLAADVASWEYSLDGGAHWNTGSGTSLTLADGSYAAGSVQVRQTDVAGNLSTAAANAAAITVDTAAPAPAFTLATDTGKSASDGITSNGAFNVSLAADTASWEYSPDAGDHWTTGTGTSFSLADGSYATGTVQVRYTDKAGNLSTAAGSTSALTIDTAAPAPSLALANDTGANTTDGATLDPNIRVTLPADTASWEYSFDGGVQWSTGTGTRFALAPGKHLAGTVQVRYVDLAGNHSPAVSNTGDYTIEQVAIPPTLAPLPVPIDGVTVTVGTVNNADGSTSQVLVVPVVPPTRVDDAGGSAVADIPLVAGSNGAPPPLAAQVPVGYGLQVTGSVGAQSAAAGLAELIREITNHTLDGSTDQSALLGSGSGFLGALPQSAPLLVQSITPTIASGAPTGTPLVISAPPSTPTGPVTALVIDGTKLPSGTVIELQNVGFAALIGPVHASGGDGQQTVFGDSAEQYIVLGADDDILHGGAGNDIVGSQGGNDQIYGDEGNDIVFGGAGNDSIDGGSGTDIVLLQGASRADYSFRFDHGRLVATQLHGGPDGTDTIANVELLRFGGAAADMGAGATLRRVYDTLFDRPADLAGATYWSSANAHGVSMHDIAAALLGSAEAAGLASLSSNAAFVDRLYLDALGAQPLLAATPQERANWVALLDQGKTDRASVIVGIANSTPKLALDAAEQSEIAFSATDASTLVRLYSTLFGRHADEAGVNYWIGQSEAGMGMHAIAGAFLQSGEAQLHYGGTGDEQFVDALYNVGLGRHASGSEIGYWADKLHSGVLSRVDLVLYFTDSPEQVTLVGNSTSLPVG